jgi:peptidoglycan DL-endopeptidase CwlO
MPSYYAPRYRYRPPRRYRGYGRMSSGRVSGRELAAVTGIALVLAAGPGRALAHHAAGHAPAAGVADAARPSTVAARKAAEAVAFAYAQLGKPYEWGATGPGGFDCSGLAGAAWRAAGVILPRVSEDQFGQGRKVTHLVPGDLVFSYWDVDDQASPNHVQIYVGGGYVIGADTTDVEKVPLSGDSGHIVGYTDPAAGS